MKDKQNALELALSQGHNPEGWIHPPKAIDCLVRIAGNGEVYTLKPKSKPGVWELQQGESYSADFRDIGPRTDPFAYASDVAESNDDGWAPAPYAKQ